MCLIFGYMSPNNKSVFDIFAIMFTNCNPQNWFMLSYVRHYPHMRIFMGFTVIIHCLGPRIYEILGHMRGHMLRGNFCHTTYPITNRLYTNVRKLPYRLKGHVKFDMHLNSLLYISAMMILHTIPC